MTLASGASASAPVPTPLTYSDQSLTDTPLEAPCDMLLPGWSALLEPMYGKQTVVRITHIATGGSDRSFYRVEPLDGRPSAIMCVTPSRAEFNNYIAIGQFLKARELPVPNFHAWSDTTGLSVLQDAGRQALQHIVLNCGPHSKQAQEAYCRVLKTLGQLQAVEAEACCEEMTCRPFAEFDLRWETEYFRENFLGRHLAWDLSGDTALTNDFDALAQRVLREPLVPMHRDFQSQNVFVDEKQVWILDFQGARLGPLQYDLASLLRDPYVSLPADVEHSLLQYYHAEAMPGTASWQAFRETYALVSLQRLMQALGAYGFLGLVKGKPWFRKWMTPALTLLSRAVEEVDGLPRLREVVAEAVQRQASVEAARAQ